MSHGASAHNTLDDWIARDAISFSIDSTESFNTAVDRLVAALGDSVDLLGIGEPLHGGEDFLILRNRLFQRLVEAHGYTAIAVESSFPRGVAVNEYVSGGGGAASYEAIQETGFSHSFGRLEANRELIEWMRQYNQSAGFGNRQLHFYGFDSPTEMTGPDSPRRLLLFALDYLASIDPTETNVHRQRIEKHLGNDADWENPAALMDPAKSIGQSPAANALRIATEELISELRIRRPELVAKSRDGPYLEAVQHASAARLLLNYHAAMARPAGTERIIEMLGIRDLMMADNLAYMIERERRREGGAGKVLAFAHNSHLKRGVAQWQLGPHALAWWPAGAHMSQMLGSRYVMIGTALGVSDDNGIGAPEAGTLEARLTAAGGPARFIPTYRGLALPPSAIADLPVRSGSSRNSTYFALTSQSFTDYDWLAVLDSTTYARGSPPLP